MRWLLWNGKLVPLLVLTAALISACASPTTGSSYKVQVPALKARPLDVACRDSAGPQSCVVVLTSDYQALVRELKAACLANRQSQAECQVAPVAK